MKSLPAAPIIMQPLVEIGAPGKTDGCNIWLASELNERELDVARLHEESHVWLWHSKRGHDIRKNEPQKYKHNLWNLATDMEIARNIYSQHEIDIIKTPRSRLKGGIVADSVENMPADLLHAEVIYDWLLHNLPKHDHKGCGCVMEEATTQENPEQPSPSAQEVVTRLREVKEEKEKVEQDKKEKEHSRQLQEQTQAQLLALRNRPPSLTEEISAALRVRHERPRSYARPGKKEVFNGLINKGRKSTPRPPLVEIYVDRSGSFDSNKTKGANDTVNKVLSRYKASIKHDTYYFGGDELRAQDTSAGGNTPYGLIIKHLKQSTPKLAIVITDDDACEDYSKDIPAQTIIICVPIGCANTKFAANSGGKDVQF